MNSPLELIEHHLDEGLTQSEAEALREWVIADRRHAKEFVRAVHQHRTIRLQLEARLAMTQSELAAEPFEAPEIGEGSSSAKAIRVVHRKRRPAPWALVFWSLHPRWAGRVIGMATIVFLTLILLRGNDPGALPNLIESRGSMISVVAPRTWLTRLAGSLSHSGFPPLQKVGTWLERFIPHHLVPGSTIQVGPGSVARVGYADQTANIEIQENSTVIILSPKSGKRFALLVGVAQIQAGPQPAQKPLQIVTPRANVRVLGTRLTIAASAKSTRVKVTEGKVRLDPRAEQPDAEVAAGQIAVAAGEAAVHAQPVRSITNHFGSGSILREIWTNIQGMKVQDLVSNPNFPDRPNGREFLPLFETQAVGTGADLYGARFRGYVHPPVTGYYTFWIAADDAAELWLSKDDRPENRRLISQAADWSRSARNWWQSPEQESSMIHLESGRRYYIEALHKEGGGGDFLSVAWQPPGSDLEVIAGADLAPFQPAEFE